MVIWQGMTRDMALRAGKARLEGISDSAALDARILLQHVCGITHEELVLSGDREISADEAARYADALHARFEAMPVARIIGERGFYGMDFALSAETLEPRPDSETLVDWVIETGKLLALPAHCLDLGTGSGCLILAAMAHLPGATGLGVDQSGDAIATAVRNADRLGLAQRVKFLQSDWYASVSGDMRFDIILSNPPYIETDAIAGLQPEVREYDPRLALDGGDDGLDAYHVIIPKAHGFLNPGGTVILECGMGQAQEIADIFEAEGFSEIETRRDLAGVERCVKAIMQG